MTRLTTFFEDLLKQPPRKRQTGDIQIPLLQVEEDSAQQQYNYFIQAQNINDRSMIDKSQHKSCSKSFYKILTNYIPVIFPISSLLLIWNLVNILVILYRFVQIPIIILIADKDEKSKKQTQLLQTMAIVSLVIIILDMIFVRPRIAYLKKQILMVDYQQLLPNYLKFQFIFDVIPAISLIIYSADIFQCPIIIRLLFYLKYYTLRQISKQVEDRLLFSTYSLAFFKFIRMVSIIYFVTSLIACIYFAIDFSYYSENNMDNFYTQNGFLWLTGSATVNYTSIIDDYSWPVWYDYALYWAVQTSSGVGYGDITPRNSMEVLFCNLVMLTTIVVFVFFAGTVLDIIGQIQENNLRKQAKLSTVNHFNKINQVNRNLRDKVKFYFQSLIRSNEDQIEKQIRQTLADKLQVDFLLSYKRQIFDNIQIMRVLTLENSVWTPFCRKVIYYMNLIYYSTGESIFEKNATSKFILGFIVGGKLTAFNAITDFEKDFNDWEYFGQKQFFFGGIILNKLISTRFTKCYFFQKDLFFSALKKFPQLYQKCGQMIDKVRFNRKETSSFGIRCENCDQEHLLEACPINSFWRQRIPKTRYFRGEEGQMRREIYDRSRRISVKIRLGFIIQSHNLDQVRKTINYFPYNNI